MKLALAIISLVVSHLSAQTPVPEREGNLQVFRTVLDEKPRILVLRMGPEQALAFDCEQGLLWKFWQAPAGELPVKLQGAVYDGVHGPQPISQGQIHFTDEKPQLITSVAEAHLQYLGHLAHSDGTTTLRWSFRDRENKTLATIAVTPAYNDGTVTISYKLDAPPTQGFQVSVRTPGSDGEPKLLSNAPLLITLKP